MESEQNPISPFYSFYITHEKTHKISVPSDLIFTISNISLNCFKDTQIQNSPTRVFAKYLKSKDSSTETSSTEISLGTLVPIKTEHLKVNFTFYSDEKIEFFVRGPHRVDLIGYFSSPDESVNKSENSEIFKQFIEFTKNEEEEEEEEEEISAD